MALKAEECLSGPPCYRNGGPLDWIGPTPMTDEAKSIVLPCSTQDFGNFISSLLGKPQTLSNTLRGPFEVASADVTNLHALLMQRISQQNDAVLTQFT